MKVFVDAPPYAVPMGDGAADRLLREKLARCREIMAGKTKLGRWYYCKNCYKNVRPAVVKDGSVIGCSECGFGFYGVLDLGREK